MCINYKTLHKLSVETKSGQALGHVKDFILDTEGQNILQYEVGAMFGKKYLISREQVISISEEKIVVEDTASQIENQVEEEGKSRQVSSGTEAVAMREES